MGSRGIKQEVRQRGVENRYAAYSVTSNDGLEWAKKSFCFTWLPEEPIIHFLGCINGIEICIWQWVDNDQDSENILDPLDVADIGEDMMVE